MTPESSAELSARVLVTENPNLFGGSLAQNNAAKLAKSNMFRRKNMAMFDHCGAYKRHKEKLNTASQFPGMD